MAGCGVFYLLDTEAGGDVEVGFAGMTFGKEDVEVIEGVGHQPQIIDQILTADGFAGTTCSGLFHAKCFRENGRIILSYTDYVNRVVWSKK